MNGSFNKMPGAWMFKIVPLFIGFIFLLILCIWGFYGFLGYKGYQAVKGGCVPALISKSVDGEQQYTIGCKK